MQKSKKAIQSGTILANLAVMVPGADLLLQSEIIPPVAKGAIILVGCVFAIWRRIAANKTITEIF